VSLDTVFKLSVIVGMIDRLSGPMARVGSTVDSSVGKIEKLNQSFNNMAKTGIAIAGVGSQIAGAMIAPVTATFGTRKALGELKSVGVKDLKTLENAAKSFSDTWAGTTKADFIGAAYDIKSGIASLSDEAVGKYTEIAGITAKGTKATTAEMTSLFATGYGIYKGFYKDMSDIDFGEMFAAGIGNTANIFKTDGASMAQAISGLGAAATSAKVPMEEQFAILGMLQATMSGGEAGTKYAAFIGSAAKAGETLGLKFTDANKQLLSMPEILGLLKGKFGETMDSAEKMKLVEAFGTDEAVDMVDLLYNKTGDLQSGILSVYGAMGNGVNEVRAMANAINDTEPDKFTVLQQRLHNVGEEVGNTLLPTFNQLLDRGGQVIDKVGAWIGKNQDLVRVISLTVITISIILAVLGVFIAGFGALGLVVTKTAGGIVNFVVTLKKIPDMLTTIRIQAMYAGDSLKAAFGGVKSFASSAATGIKNVSTSIFNMARAAAVNGATAVKNFVVSLVQMARQAVTTAVTAMPGLIASVWAFTVALLANPMTWVVIGIVALIAALVLLWQNWDSVVSFFSNSWPKITGAFSSGIQSVKDFITGSLAWFKESGAKVLTTFTEGITSAVSAPVNAVKGALGKIREMLPFSDAHVGPLSELTLSGRRVFETITSGMIKTKNLPADVTEQAFNGVSLAATLAVAPAPDPVPTPTSALTPSPVATPAIVPAVAQEPAPIPTPTQALTPAPVATPAIVPAVALSPDPVPTPTSALAQSPTNVTSREEVKKVNIKEITREKAENNQSSKDKEKATIIEKLIIQVDINKLKDLPMLFKLLKEIEDYTNGNGSDLVGEG